jgi:hypothetical protein
LPQRGDPSLLVQVLKAAQLLEDHLDQLGVNVQPITDALRVAFPGFSEPEDGLLKDVKLRGASFWNKDVVRIDGPEQILVPFPALVSA